MTTTPYTSMAFAGLVFTAASSQAEIVTNDLSGLASLSPTNSSVAGITVAPISDLEGRDSSLNASYFGGESGFTIHEAGAYYLGVGQTVPVGTDLTNFTSLPGTQLTFAETLPTDRYFAPFYKDPQGPGALGTGYLTFDYDNPTKSITFVSSTVQTEPGETLEVVPEPAVSLLGSLGMLILLRRRR